MRKILIISFAAVLFCTLTIGLSLRLYFDNLYTFTTVETNFTNLIAFDIEIEDLRLEKRNTIVEILNNITVSPEYRTNLPELFDNDLRSKNIKIDIFTNTTVENKPFEINRNYFTLYYNEETKPIIDELFNKAYDLLSKESSKYQIEIKNIKKISDEVKNENIFIRILQKLPVIVIISVFGFLISIIINIKNKKIKNRKVLLYWIYFSIIFIGFYLVQIKPNLYYRINYPEWRIIAFQQTYNFKTNDLKGEIYPTIDLSKSILFKDEFSKNILKEIEKDSIFQPEINKYSFNTYPCNNEEEYIFSMEIKKEKFLRFTNDQIFQNIIIHPRNMIDNLKKTGSYQDLIDKFNKSFELFKELNKNNEIIVSEDINVIDNYPGSNNRIIKDITIGIICILLIIISGLVILKPNEEKTS